MSPLHFARDLLDESVALADAVSLRFKARPLVVTPVAISRQSGNFCPDAPFVDKSGPENPSALVNWGNGTDEVTPVKRSSSTKVQHDINCLGAGEAQNTGLPSISSILPYQLGADKLRSRSFQFLLSKLHFEPRPWTIRKRIMATAMLPLVLPGAIALSAHLRAEAVTERVINGITRTHGLVILDAAGNFGGVRRHLLGSPDRVVAPLRKAPPIAFFTMLRWSEDRHASTNFYGMDVPSTGWSVLCEMIRPIGGLQLLNKVRRCSGASTLLSSIVEAARGTGNRNRNYKMKFWELADTWALSVTHDIDQPRTQAIIADVASYVQGVGGNVWGLELSSRVLWGKSASELSIAQSALMVTAFRRPIRITCKLGAAPPDSDFPWLKRVALAKTIILKSLPANASRDAAVLELDSMQPVVAPAMDDPMLATLSLTSACTAAGNPIERANLLASTVALRVDQELARLKDGVRPTEVRVTVDLATNRRFVIDTLNNLDAMGQAQASRLHVPLTGTGDDVADGAMLVVDAQGHIQRIFSASAHPNFSTLRRTASLSKLIIAAAAAIDGRDPNAPLCNHIDERFNTRNADGTSGFRECAGPAMVSASEAMAASQTLAWLHLARSLKADSLAKAAKAFGAEKPNGIDLATALGIGVVEVAPERWIANLMALENGLNGRPATALLPTIIESATNYDGLKLPTSSTTNVDLSDIFLGAFAHQWMGTVAKAPLTHPRGTLNHAVSSLYPVAMTEISKTGSDVMDEDGNLRSKQVIGAFEHGSYYGGIWVQTHSLGRKIEMTPLWRWLRSEAHSQVIRAQ